MNNDSVISPLSSSCEILTVEQVAERLQISRATLFAWMQQDILSQGRHYFKRGHVLRFLWSAELIQELLTGSPATVAKVPLVKPFLKPVRQLKSSPLNWEY
jgi:transposase-like protein